MTGADEDAERMWAAIADPTRRQLLDRILAAGDTTASALARDLPITRQGIAKHLAVLERAGLVRATRTGREVRFTVREERLDQATRRMAQILARWDERVATIKRLAENEPGAPRHGPARTGR
jgi:DNA-binding transcriptional ArsR family regulator